MRQCNQRRAEREFELIIGSSPALKLALARVECVAPTDSTVLPSSGTWGDSDHALIVEALEEVGWVVGGPRGAAAKLGMKRTTLLAKMKRLGISRPIAHEVIDAVGVARESAQI